MVPPRAGRWQPGGEAACRRERRPVPARGEDVAVLQALVAERNDRTLAEPCALYAPHARVGLSLGLSRAGLVACMSVAGAADAPVIVALAAPVLAPVPGPGLVVVMHRLSQHKAPRVREVSEAAGCRLLFRPPYSPDLNAIEPAWSKVKTLSRDVGARTTEALDAALTTLVDAIIGTPTLASYTWMARPPTASAASLTASGSVGCA